MPVTSSSPRLHDAGFEHGFSSRAEGDFGRGKDDPARLAEDLLLCQQVHGAQIYQVTAATTAAEAHAFEADALLTRVPGRAVGVRTADCVPLLIADLARGHVAAVHAGWRGVAGRILAEAVRALGGSPRDLHVAIGPCIGPCCFEVGPEVADALRDASDESCILHTSNKPKIDLRTALSVQLDALGVESYERVGGCTRCESALYHSHRRDGERAGRMIAFVRAR